MFEYGVPFAGLALGREHQISPFTQVGTPMGTLSAAPRARMLPGTILNFSALPATAKTAGWHKKA